MPFDSVLRFVKMQGLGNDFVLLDDLQHPSRPPSSSLEEGKTPVSPELIRALCDRRFGVGADQIIWLLPPSKGSSFDTQVRFFNADGSEAEMCGNGIRAVAVYLASSGPRAGATRYVAETEGGVQALELESSERVKVTMRAPRLLGGFDSSDGRRLRVGEREVRVFEVNLGNPHAVVFVNRLEEYPVEEVGPKLERHSEYPERTNVEFVEVLGPGRIRVRVWERGAGFTLACGTGACASAVAAIATGRVSSPVSVELPGGELEISWSGEGSSVIMVGPATEVFRGEIDLSKRGLLNAAERSPRPNQ